MVAIITIGCLVVVLALIGIVEYVMRLQRRIQQTNSQLDKIDESLKLMYKIVSEINNQKK